MEYKDMVTKMHKYLTGKYKCREGSASMSPLAYADSLAADAAVKILRDAITELEKNIKKLEETEINGGAAKNSKSFLQNLMKKDDYEARGTEAPADVMSNTRDTPIVAKEAVTAERAIQAKTRLQAFQETRKQQPPKK
jgi:hypothetical protein